MTDVPLPQPGRCYCGALHLELTALPLVSYLCHCSICRRRTGAAYGISTFVPAGAIRFTQGEVAHRDRLLSNGGKGALTVCAACGQPIYSSREDASHWTFRPGLLDDSSWITPVGQIWTQNALPWALLKDVPSFEGHADNFQLMLEAWKALSLRAAGINAP